MEDEVPPAEKRYPLSTAKLSKTPSWIMLGFLLGAAFVALLQSNRKPAGKPQPEIRSAEAAPPAAPKPRGPEPLTTIEAVFADWGHLAVWSDDVTEVALWNVKDEAFNEFYEVRRFGGVAYFRTIPQLTRRLIARGKPIPSCPLQFTETAEQYQEWYQHGRSERPADRDLRPVITGSRPSTTAPLLDPPAKAPPPALEKIIPSLETKPAKEEDPR